MLVGYAWSLPPESEVRRLVDFYDFGFCAYFFVAFVKRFRAAEDKRKYMMPWGILDLLSAISAVESLRFARVFRIVLVYRLLIAAHSLRKMFGKNPREATYSIAGGTIACALISLSILVLHFESQHVDAKIATAGDALWWSVVTLSTVGYGDLYPITNRREDLRRDSDDRGDWRVWRDRGHLRRLADAPEPRPKILDSNLLACSSSSSLRTSSFA